MKIAIFSDAFHPQVNGIVTSILSIAENMVERGHEVIIIAPRYSKIQEYDHPGIKVFRMMSMPAAYYDDFRWSLPHSPAALKILRRENVDIVHFMTPIFVSLVGIKVARKLKLPLVGTFHTFIADPLYFEQLFNGPVKVTEKLTWRYLNLFYDSADYVTAPTPESVDIIKRNGCIAPMEAVSNGIDFSMIGGSKTEEMKRKYNLGDKVVLYIGRISFEKNIGGLIDAFDIVHKRIPDAQLLLVGDGPKLDFYKKYVQEKPCRDNIIFTGLIPHQELLDSGLIKNAKLFATMSGTETQGITILEAQANELISVGVPEGGLVDLIKDGENGFMAETGNSEDMADKICHVLENHEHLQHMKNKAREMALSHDLKKVIDRWEEIYQDLIDKNQQGLLERKKPLRFRNLLNFAREFKLDNEYFKKRFGLSS